MAKKLIDIMDIRKAIKNGDIEVYTDRENQIFICDVRTSEIISIGNFKELKRINYVSHDLL